MARQFTIACGEIARITNLDAGHSLGYGQVLEHERRRLMVRVGGQLPVNAVVKVELPGLLIVGEVAACQKQGDVFSAYLILSQFMHVESELGRLQSALSAGIFKPTVASTPASAGVAAPARES